MTDRVRNIEDSLTEIMIVQPYYHFVNRLPYLERIELGQLKDLLQLERKCRRLGREPVKLTLCRDNETISVGLDRLVELAEQDLLYAHNGSFYFIVDGVCWKLDPPLGGHPQKDASP
jgi:hypothetical protein